jgi:CubicO group peptidase (beta-lactamase class C family)
MKKILLFFVLSLFSLRIIFAQYSYELNKQIDQCVKGYFQDKKFNGSLLVAKKGKILYMNGFGYASIEKKINNTESTNFLIGSATKSFTAIAVMRCVEKGLLNLHTPVRDYIPELTGEVGELTLHYLMKNSSGLPVHLKRITELEYRDISSEELLGLYNTIELSFKPGTKYEYSNLNYQLCAIVIERVSGLSYIDYMNQFIFIPLGMSQSGIQRTNDFIEHRATGYDIEDGKLSPSPKNYLAYAMGGGDIYSNILDLLKWDQALYGKDLLNQVSLDLLFDGSPDQYGGYGYGFKIKPYQRNIDSEGKLVRHGGSMYGFICNIHRYIEDQVTIIILGNIRPYPVMEITEKIEKILLDNSCFR